MDEWVGQDKVNGKITFESMDQWVKGWVGGG